MIDFIDLPTIEELKVYVIDQLKNNDFFAAAGFFSLLGTFWLTFKKVPLFLWTRIKRKIVYEVNIYETDPFYKYFEKWLSSNQKNSYRSTEIQIHRTYDHNGNVESEKINYNQFLDVFYIRKGLCYISIWKGREKLENASTKDNAFLNHFKIKGFFAKKVINKWMKIILDWNQQENQISKQSNILINRNDYWYSMNKIKSKKICEIFIKDKYLLLEDIDKFIKNKNWYMDRGIVYKRGYYLYGSPGTGKTSIICSIASYLNRDLYFLNPTGVTSDLGLLELYCSLTPNSIVVIEDIDTIFNNKREKEDKSIKFNFSSLLNCLDGVFSKEGIITFFTTNHPERLDLALIREGRMDFHFKVDLPQKKEIEDYLNMFFQKENSYVEIGNNRNTSMVKIQEICIRYNNYSKVVNEIEDTILLNEMQKQLI